MKRLLNIIKNQQTVIFKQQSAIDNQQLAINHQEVENNTKKSEIQDFREAIRIYKTIKVIKLSLILSNCSQIFRQNVK